MPLPTRPLGLNGPQVSAIGLGTMSIGGCYGQTDTEETRLALLDRAHALGATFWDTADIYVNSEDTIGAWFARSGKREDIFLATKCGIQFDVATGVQTVRSDREYIFESCERSLGKLRTEWIDLFYCHRVARETPVEESMRAMVELIGQGKIRHIGLSEVSAATIRRAHAIHPVAAVQVEYSPFSLEIESDKIDVLRTCRELGIAVIAYSPMGRGLLTGQIKSSADLPSTDVRRWFPKFSETNFPKIMDLVEKLRAVAERHGISPAQLCLAWLLAQGPEVIPIPGTRTVAYLEENVGAAGMTLTEDEAREIRETVDATELEGERYPASMMGEIFGDTVEVRA